MCQVCQPKTHIRWLYKEKTLYIRVFFYFFIFYLLTYILLGTLGTEGKKASDTNGLSRAKLIDFTWHKPGTPGTQLRSVPSMCAKLNACLGGFDDEDAGLFAVDADASLVGDAVAEGVTELG